MMQHLIGLGHRSFAMIAGIPNGNDRQRARIAAYADAIATAGLEGVNRVFARAHAIGNGVGAMRDIRAAFPQATAIVCNTDVFAFGALHACKELGLKVPDDVSITGFDNAEYAALLDPPLTTLAVPAQEMGVRAAKALHQVLTGGGKLKPQQLATKLVIRQSAGSPPENEVRVVLRIKQGTAC